MPPSVCSSLKSPASHARVLKALGMVYIYIYIVIYIYIYIFTYIYLQHMVSAYRLPKNANPPLGCKVGDGCDERNFF